MKRWSTTARAEVEVPAIDVFLEEVIAVCRKHGFSLSHEDGHGGFKVERPSDRNFDWLREAADSTGEQA